MFDQNEYMEEKFDRVFQLLENIEKGIKLMAVDQTTFDTDLAGLVSAITDLDNAVDTWVASHPDLSAEDQSVQTAAAAVSAELAKINPTPPAPAPAGG